MGETFRYNIGLISTKIKATLTTPISMNVSSQPCLLRRMNRKLAISDTAAIASKAIMIGIRCIFVSFCDL